MLIKVSGKSDEIVVNKGGAFSSLLMALLVDLFSLVHEEKGMIETFFFFYLRGQL